MSSQSLVSKVVVLVLLASSASSPASGNSSTDDGDLTDQAGELISTFLGELVLQTTGANPLKYVFPEVTTIRSLGRTYIFENTLTNLQSSLYSFKMWGFPRRLGWLQVYRKHLTAHMPSGWPQWPLGKPQGLPVKQSRADLVFLKINFKGWAPGCKILQKFIGPKVASTCSDIQPCSGRVWEYLIHY